MLSVAAVAIGALVLVLILVSVPVIARRQAGRRRPPEYLVYVTADAVEFAARVLDPEVLDRLGKAGVRRIIEWSTHYLQGLAVPARRRRKGLRVVAGGEGSAIEYIHLELAKRGHEYAPDDIAAVLAGEAGYLAGIGALGGRVDEQEPV